MVTEEAIVEAYAGASYPERPRRFSFDGEDVQVASVERRRRTPNALEFRVKGEDGRLYDLTYDFRTRKWQISPLE